MRARFAVIPFSALCAENRWDAGFHTTLIELRVQLAKLRAAMSAEKARELLGLVPLAEKKPLLVLSRGGKPSLNSETIERVEREYPHLALAIVRENIGPILERAESDARAYRAIVDQLQRVVALQGDK